MHFSRLLPAMFFLAIPCAAQSIIPRHIESPEYPRLAMAARIQGKVLLTVRIAVDGKVVSATASTGHALLREYAEKSVKSWVFNEGEERTLEMSYEFSLVEPDVYCPRLRVTFELPARVLIVSNLQTPESSKSSKGAGVSR
jgi:TonB family protein